MFSLKQLAVPLTAAIALSACAGRSPNPVAITSASDTSVSCDALRAEVAANTTKISSLGREKGAKVAQNVVAGVTGLFIWPLWFAMDFQGAASTEQKALEERNKYIGTLSATCTEAITVTAN